MQQEQHHRRSIRLLTYNYSQEGYYFVTICAHNYQELFGNIVGATRGSPPRMILNEWGKIVVNIWKTLPAHHPVKLDTFQIMPNHVHFIINLLGNRLRPVRSGGSRPNSGGSRPAPTLGVIVGLFKSVCTKQIRRTIENPNKIIWQRNYYEHIVRNEESLDQIREYIEKNPENWEYDRNNPLNIKK